MTIPAADPSPPNGQGDRQRDSLFLLARMRVGDGEVVREVRVRNLSDGGLMAEYDRAVPVGEAVALEMRGVGKVTGRIAWSEQGRVGVTFDRPIDPKAARKPVGVGTADPIYAPLYTKAPPRR